MYIVHGLKTEPVLWNLINDFFIYQTCKDVILVLKYHLEIHSMYRCYVSLPPLWLEFFPRMECHTQENVVMSWRALTLVLIH